MPSHIVAFEIGSSHIKGAVGTVDDSGNINIVAVEEAPLVGCVRYGCVLNVEETGNRILEIKRKLENHATVSPLKITGAYVSIGGRSLTSFAVETSRTLGGETEITREIVGQLKKQAKSCCHTDKEILSVTTVSNCVDGRWERNPVGMFGTEIKGRFSIVTASTDIKKNLQRAFDRANLKILGYAVRPLAQAETVLTPDERSLGCVLVDLGAETTTVSIYKDRAMRYLATIPLGGRAITRDLAAALNLTEDRAEEIKRFQGSALVMDGDNLSPRNIDGLDTTTINNYVRARASEIVANVMQQLNYAHMRPEDLPAGFILTGGTSALGGLKDLLHRDSDMKVRNAIPATLVKFTDPKIYAGQMVDIISIISVAHRIGNKEECLTEYRPKPQPQPQQRPGIHHQPTAGYNGGRMTDYNNPSSTSTTAAQPEPNSGKYPTGNRPETPGERIHKEMIEDTGGVRVPTWSQFNDKKDDDDDDKPTKATKGGTRHEPVKKSTLLGKIKDKLYDIVSENEDDDFDNNAE